MSLKIFCQQCIDGTIYPSYVVQSGNKNLHYYTVNKQEAVKVIQAILKFPSSFIDNTHYCTDEGGIQENLIQDDGY